MKAKHRVAIYEIFDRIEELEAIVEEYDDRLGQIWKIANEVPEFSENYEEMDSALTEISDLANVSVASIKETRGTNA